MWLPTLVAVTLIYMIFGGITAVLAMTRGSNLDGILNAFLVVVALPSFAALGIGFAVWILLGFPTN